MSKDSSSNGQVSPNYNKVNKAGIALTTVLITLGIFVIANIVAGVVFYGLRDLIQDIPVTQELSSPETFVLYGMTSIASISLIVAVASDRFKVDLRKTARKLGLNKPSVEVIKYLIIGFGLYFGAILLILGGLEILNLLPESAEQNVGFNDASGTRDLIYTFIALVILAPIAEELLFRGFLYRRLKYNIGGTAGALIVSILFGLAHVDYQNIPGSTALFLDTFILSLAMIYALDESDNLLSSMLIHSLKNGIAFYVLFIS